MVKYHQSSLDLTFAALADPTRRAIVARLAEGESCVTELATPFDMSLPAISKHLRILENAGLIARKKRGRVHHFRLVARPMKDAIEWMARYRYFWEKQFEALSAYLNESQKVE